MASSLFYVIVLGGSNADRTARQRIAKREFLLALRYFLDAEVIQWFHPGPGI